MMIKTQFKNILAIGLASMLSLFSCDDQIEDLQSPPFLKVEQQSLNFGENGEIYILEVRCNEEYSVKTADGLEDWCGLKKLENGDLELEIHPNEDTNIRRGRIFIHALSQSDTLNVAQLGWGKAILLSQSTFNVGESGENISVDITANIDYDLDMADFSWIEHVPVATSRGAHDAVTKTCKFTVRANNKERRIGTITVKDKEEVSDIEPAIISVIQKGLESYIPGAPEIGEDILLTASSVIGDGGAPNSDWNAMIDHEFDGAWQSRWKPADGGLKPEQYLEFTFDEKVNMDYIVYHTGGTLNRIKGVKVSVMMEVDGILSDEYVEVFNGELPNAVSARIDFNAPQTDVRKVKMDLLSCHNADKPYQCKEMEFYYRNPKNFDYTTLFRDPACSELKEGITETDILNCTHAFFKNLAWYMYNGKYPRQFRIADYKAYEHPDKQAKINKTWTYSLLDNPTGISVAKGEQVAVMADLKGRKDISICVLNLDQPDADGFNTRKTYPIAEGINSITMEDKGLIYVMYHTDDYENAPAIRLHFTSGKVNGYYDKENLELQGRWKELLNASVDTHFDVLGKYVHMTFPTRSFLNYTKDVDALITLYDDMIYRQQEFLGLVKYDKMFKNRSYFNVIYKNDAFMYATAYHTAYIESTMNYVADETKFADNCWGPAHELGHTHQTRPGLTWHGTTEVTNNITVLHVQTSVFNKPSRMQTEVFKGFPSRYGYAWSTLITGEKTAIEVPGAMLIPFWQLELYFGKVLGNTPMQREDHGGFYPDVYEYVRNNPDPKTPGACQLEFVYNCCVNAKADLTDFFEKWGFLTPVDINIFDYSDKQFTITQSEVDALKNRVVALGYSKPGVALEYITDNTVELYKSKPSITKGSAVRSGNEIVLNGWQNVVAFEVVNGNEKPVYITEGSVKNFTVTSDWKSSYKLYAVAVNGNRIDTGIK